MEGDSHAAALTLAAPEVAHGKPVRIAFRISVAVFLAWFCFAGSCGIGQALVATAKQNNHDDLSVLIHAWPIAHTLFIVALVVCGIRIKQWNAGRPARLVLLGILAAYVATAAISIVAMRSHIALCG